ncbi:MAG: serine/threonine protein kinase [Firmicutes bacterium]|nr:serine/threonine protein kinase [Bacillota bacterium]
MGFPPAVKLLNNRYKIIGEVKSGAMGCVYEAQDVNLNVTIALKKLIVSEDCDEFEEAKRAFQREAAILSRLDHPGLPQVTDFFTDTDPETGHSACWLVMSYIDGEDMETMLKRNAPPYSKKWVVRFALSILNILHYLHSQNPPIIYRDLKPSNILIAGKTIYLVDFGIARTLDLSHKGTQIGTPGYAPPEQYKGYTDERSDIYSLGVLLHYLLTGKNPEDNPDLFTFKPIYKVNPDLGFEISDLVESMTSIVPDKRPANVNVVIDSLIRNAPPGIRQISAGASTPAKNPKDIVFEAAIIVILIFIHLFVFLVLFLS